MNYKKVTGIGLGKVGLTLHDDIHSTIKGN